MGGHLETLDPPSSFDRLRMRATGDTFEILILSLSKDEDFAAVVI
jgi:hypothetical protein